MKYLLFSLLLTACTSSAFAAEIRVDKTELALDGQTYHNNLSLTGYFQKRDLGNYSLGEDAHTGAPRIFRDTKSLDFTEMFLISLSDPAPLGRDGRVATIKKIYGAYLSSLKNENGACNLELRSENKLIGIEQFVESSRSASGQPGTRLMLSKDDVKSPSWELLCPNTTGQMLVTKKGDYFFAFIDFYENINPAALKDHLVNYLIAFR